MYGFCKERIPPREQINKLKIIMNEKVLKHYLGFSIYTDPGLYKNILIKDLPNDIREIGLLVRKNIIHRTTLSAGNIGTNADLRFGDMTKVPWWRQPEDDILVTAAAMLAELYRRDPRGFTLNRTPENKIVVTCRFVSILMATILKSKGFPTVCRSGFASYFAGDNHGNTKISWDHWLNEYWNEKEKRWVLIDVDGSLSLGENFNPYDMPEGKFDYAADAWINVREERDKAERFRNGDDIHSGLLVILWSLFYDFHALMNDEIIYTHGPACNYGYKPKFESLTEEELKRVDNLAHLMQSPDENFDALTKIWETEKDFRLLKGGLL